VATNYKILGEQIQRIYSRSIDREDIEPRIDYREVKPIMVQVINSLLKIEHLQRSEVSGTSVATYILPKQTATNYEYVQLTVTPISLPKEQGVHRVYKEGCPWAPFIPIRTGDFEIAFGTPTAYLEGQVGYYLNGTKIIFTKPVSENIEVQLVVNDPALVSDTDLLPIPPEMEQMVIQGVLQLIGVPVGAQMEQVSKTESVVTNPRQVG
jgi:hypothetical protein